MKIATELLIPLLIVAFGWSAQAAEKNNGSASVSNGTLTLDQYKNIEEFIGNALLWWPGSTPEYDHQGETYSLQKCESNSYNKCESVRKDLDGLSLWSSRERGYLRLRPGFYKAKSKYGFETRVIKLSDGDKYRVAAVQKVLVSKWEGDEKISVNINFDLMEPKYQKLMEDRVLRGVQFPITLEEGAVESPKMFNRAGVRMYYICQTVINGSDNDFSEGHKKTCKTALDLGQMQKNEYLKMFLDIKSSVSYEKLELGRARKNLKVKESSDAGLWLFLHDRKDLSVLGYDEASKVLVLGQYTSVTSRKRITDSSPTGNTYSLFYGSYVAEFINSQGDTLEIPFKAGPGYSENIDINQSLK